MVRNEKQSTTAMDPASRFFQDVSSRSINPLLRDLVASVRVDLTDGDKVDHFLVVIDRGDVSVSKRASRADAILRVDRDVFNKMVEGRMNATAAVLRGEITIEGDLGIVMLLARVFPGPPSSHSALVSRYDESHK
jgi:putative sterol carrier protein